MGTRPFLMACLKSAKSISNGSRRTSSSSTKVHRSKSSEISSRKYRRQCLKWAGYDRKRSGGLTRRWKWDKSGSTRIKGPVPLVRSVRASIRRRIWTVSIWRGTPRIILLWETCSFLKAVRNGRFSWVSCTARRGWFLSQSTRCRESSWSWT